MPGRRKLPAPPLVLSPVFSRVPTGSPQALQLLELASLLQRRGLLTDGGEKKLAQGLESHNQMVSLTLQDVRAWAHGLVCELLETDPTDWTHRHDQYFSRFDKGKPRKPNRLQRLLIEWSADRGWRGLLQAAALHPRLWPEIGSALQLLTEEETAPWDGRAALRIAYLCRRQGDARPWLEAGQSQSHDWWDLLPRLELPPQPAVRELINAELDRLTGSESQLPLVLVATLSQGLSFPGGLLLAWIEQQTPPYPAPLMAQLVPHLDRQQRATAVKLLSADPKLRAVRYGPRPGTPWLETLLYTATHNS